VSYPLLGTVTAHCDTLAHNRNIIAGASEGSGSHVQEGSQEAQPQAQRRQPR